MESITTSTEKVCLMRAKASAMSRRKKLQSTRNRWRKKALESIRKHNRDTDKDKDAAIADFNAAVQRYIVNGPWQALFVRAENIPQSDFKQQKPGASDEWMWEFNEPTPPSDTPGSGGGDFTPESPEPKTASVAGKKSDHINHVPKATESTLFLTEDAKVMKKTPTVVSDTRAGNPAPHETYVKPTPGSDRSNWSLASAEKAEQHLAQMEREIEAELLPEIKSKTPVLVSIGQKLPQLFPWRLIIRLKMQLGLILCCRLLWMRYIRRR